MVLPPVVALDAHLVVGGHRPERFECRPGRLLRQFEEFPLLRQHLGQQISFSIRRGKAKGQAEAWQAIN